MKGKTFKCTKKVANYNLESQVLSHKHSPKGITLVALVVTIVVLLILAGITITMLFGENGIIRKAQDAANATKNAQNTTMQGLQNLVNQMDTILNGSESGPVTNPYDPNDWDLAWTCTDGVWSDAPLNKGETAEGDIIAKFYLTGNKITPPSFSWGGIDFAFLEGDEYHMVIEGEGEMGPLIGNISDLKTFYAWHKQTAQYMAGNSDTCIIPYVSEATICNGITNIGDVAFGADGGLKKITIGNDVTNIGARAFGRCVSLTNIDIPNVTRVGDEAFFEAMGLTSINMPNVITIGTHIFYDCENLEIIKLGVTDATALTLASDTFNYLQDRSIIYVLNEGVKTKLDGTYDSTKTTVQVVTQEEMDKI